MLGAAYMLWLYQRTMFGKIENPANQKLLDLNLRELATIDSPDHRGVLDWPVSGAVLQGLEKPVNKIVARFSPDFFQGSAASLKPRQEIAANGSVL